MEDRIDSGRPAPSLEFIPDAPTRLRAVPLDQDDLSPLPTLRTPEADPVAAAVVLWGRCGYIPSSRIPARDEDDGSLPDPNSGS